MKRKLINLSNQRTILLNEAERALTDGNQAEYTAAMEKVNNLNTEISNIRNLIAEQERKVLDGPAASAAEQRDMAEERGAAMLRGDAVKFSALETLRAVRSPSILNATTLATGTIVEPSGAGSNVRDPLGNMPSSIVDQVYVQDLTGMGSFDESYVISEIDAKGGNTLANAGKARADSTDPVFGVARIKPYDMNVTAYVDRNISRLSPAAYYTKIYNMAMRAMRRTLAGLIVNGDGQATPDMFGIKNARNTAGNAIYSTVDVSGIDENLLDELFFSYGGDSAVGLGARVYLTKQDLKAIGKLRNTHKERVFKIHPDANPNTGTIEDGGTFIPYTIVPDLTSLANSAAGADPVQTLLYGDPMYYELGLFGEFSVRVDESIKGVERMYTILGDATVGGNLIADKGFSVATVPVKN